jgi:hypothetical protein
MNDRLLETIRFYFAQSVFCNKCHYKAADRLAKKEVGLTVFTGSVSALTVGVLILKIIGFDEKCQLIIHITSYLGLLATFISLLLQIFNRNDRVQQIFQHKMYAEKYKALRDEYMNLIEETMATSFTEEQIRLKREMLQERYSALGEDAPQTTADDYKQAQISLGIYKIVNEEFSWSDQEIDKFLPKQLKIK